MTTTATINKADLMPPPVAEIMQTRSMFIGLIGAVASVAGAFLAPESFYSAYLTVFMVALSLSLGCMSILMLYHLVGGAWGTVSRRTLEAGMMTLPLMAALFIPIAVNLPRLYEWARPDELAKNTKLADIAHSYLNPSGIASRAVLYFVLWFAMAFLLNKWSTEQDNVDAIGRSTLRFRALSGPGLVIYSLTFSFAIIDWVMSMQARWISTIYGLIFIAGAALSTYCFVVLVETILGQRKPMSQYLRSTEVHDHGNFMLAFVMVWAYFNFSQWLIMWSGNLPEEIIWFLRRLHGGWGVIAMGLVLFHFAVPFALLLSQRLKKQTTTLVWIASLLLFMRLVEIFWHIEPAQSLHHDTFHISWTLFAALFGIGGLWMAYFFRNLRARPLLAVYAPQTLRLLEPSHE
ncbi:MAG: hypothetical protein DMG80_14325 [Acidobacteria bacterium]|nr:MAG: hypothetical protein DMG80_14325 [Acidobacteriota bacterium]